MHLWRVKPHCVKNKSEAVQDVWMEVLDGMSKIVRVGVTFPPELLTGLDVHVAHYVSNPCPELEHVPGFEQGFRHLMGGIVLALVIELDKPVVIGINDVIICPEGVRVLLLVPDYLQHDGYGIPAGDVHPHDDIVPVAFAMLKAPEQNIGTLGPQAQHQHEPGDGQYYRNNSHHYDRRLLHVVCAIGASIRKNLVLPDKTDGIYRMGNGLRPKQTF